MLAAHKLGIYWGTSGISLVELNKDVPVCSAFVAFSELGEDVDLAGVDLSKDLRLLEIFQKGLRSAPFSLSNTYVSFPSNDIIIRWFVIPWVKPEEIQGMVAFEAKKYIPFPLSELVFNYYPTIVTQGGNRQIVIVLAAIRKVQYDRYNSIFIQSGVNVVYSEPSVMSLLRALAHRRLINTDEVTGILSVREDTGEIFIACNGHVRFIRDFSLRMPQVEPGADLTEFVRSKLVNEIRMSLDYFTRINSGPEVQRIIGFSSGLHQPFFDSIDQDISIPLQRVDSSQILDKFDAMPDIGYVRAFGVALSGSVPAIIDFDLREEHELAGKTKKKESPSPLAVLPKVLMVAGAILCSAAMAGVSWNWAEGQLRAKEMAKQEVMDRLGRFSDTPREDIDAKVALLTKRDEAVKSLPLRSSLTPVMVRLVQLLPDGIWLNSMDIEMKEESSGGAPPSTIEELAAKAAKARRVAASDYYTVKSVIVMTVTGQAFLNDTNAEFALVDKFVESISKDEQLTRTFPVMKLKTLTTGDVGKKKVTLFTIEFR